MLHTEQYPGKAASPRAPAIIITLPIIFHHSSHGPAGLTQGRTLPESGREHQLSAAACILLHQPISPPAPTRTVRLDTEVIPALQVSSSHQNHSDCKPHFSSTQGSALHVPVSPVLGEAELFRCTYLGSHFGIVSACQQESKEAGERPGIRERAQQVLADFLHSQFTAPKEGPGDWREQRQAGVSRSPGSGWAEVRIDNQCGQQTWVWLASSTRRGSKAAGTAPALYSCFHSSSPRQHSLLVQSFQPGTTGTEHTNSDNSLHGLLTKTTITQQQRSS